MTKLFIACLAAAKYLWPEGVGTYLYRDPAKLQEAKDDDWLSKARSIYTAMLESGMPKQLWVPVEELPERLHSTPMEVKLVLIRLLKDKWTIGHYVGDLDEWHALGSNSQVYPTHFMDVDATLDDK